MKNSLISPLILILCTLTARGGGNYTRNRSINAKKTNEVLPQETPLALVSRTLPQTSPALMGGVREGVRCGRSALADRYSRD